MIDLGKTGKIMNEDLKKVFRNSGITTIIIFVYGLIIRQSSVYIASTLGAILSLLNLYLIYKDAEFLVYTKDGNPKKRVLSYSKRMVLNGLFLFFMVKVDFKWFVSGILGLLVVKLNILLIMLKAQLNNIFEKLKI